MNLRQVVAGAVVALAAVAAICVVLIAPWRGNSHQTATSPATSTSSRVTSSKEQSPSPSAATNVPTTSTDSLIPTTCAAGAIVATTVSGTTPLLSCAETAGNGFLTSISLNVGEEVTIAGTGLATDSTLTATPGGITRLVQGRTFVAVSIGAAVLSANDLSCLPRPDGTQPTTCDLVRVIVE
jgi:hypothetical protein